MMDDPRFHQGIALFNTQEYFDAHEVWEELWHECPPMERRFIQSLIQAAVSLYHWGNANAVGAVTLYRRGLEKATDYPAVYHGLPLAELWTGVEATLFHHALPPYIVLRTAPLSSSP
jgi:uncharacterized protein